MLYKKSHIIHIKKKGRGKMKEIKTYQLKAYDEIKTIKLEETSYVDGTFAIAMYSWDPKGKYWQPWDILTVNLLETDKTGRKAFVQTDKYLKFVLDNKLGIQTGGSAKSGYKHYTEIEFKKKEAW